MNTTFFRRKIAVAIMLFGVFVPHVTQAQFSDSNSLLSLVQNNAGGILNAALSCNRHVNSFLDRFTSFGEGQAEGQIGGGSGGGFEAVRVVDQGVAASSNRTAQAARATQKKLTCKNAIEKAAAQALLKELTFRTVNWINNGFQDGRSIFIPDTKTFLQDLRDQEVNRLASIIGFDQENFPFGRQVAQQLLLSSRSYFERDLAYNLSKLVANQYPGLTSANFYANFSIGGWDAFLAQSYPNNNPYGFQLSAQDALARYAAETAYSKAEDLKDQLQRNLGFLDLKECADPTWREPSESQIEQLETIDDPEERRRAALALDCPQWVTKTPGSIAGKQLASVLESPIRQLEIGDDLSASLTSIFDALTVQLINKGLSSLEADENYVANDPNFERSYSFNYASTLIDNTGLGFNGSNDQWWKRDDFDLLNEGEKGLGPLIEQESDYEEIFRGGPNVPVGQEEVLQTYLIPAIHQLDFCIPGPNPEWEAIAQQNIQILLNETPKSADEVLGSGSKIVSGILGFGNGFNDQIRNGTIDSRNEQLYSDMLHKILGVGVVKNDKLAGFARFSYIMTELVDRYAEAIEENYGMESGDGIDRKIPAIATENIRLYRELPGYRQGIVDAESERIDAAVIRSQLQRLFERVQELNATYPDPANLPEEEREDYEEDYDRIERTFLRLAPDIHTAEDILNQRDILDNYIREYDNIVREDGFIDRCFEETSESDYVGRKSRMPYPEQLLGSVLFDERLGGFFPDPKVWTDSFLQGGLEVLLDDSTRERPFYRFEPGAPAEWGNWRNRPRDANGNPATPWYFISTEGLFDTELYGANNNCGTYYNPETVSYGSNLFGKPKFRSGEGRNPHTSCTAGLENVLGVY